MTDRIVMTVEEYNGEVHVLPISLYDTEQQAKDFIMDRYIMSAWDLKQHERRSRGIFKYMFQLENVKHHIYISKI